MSSPFHANPTLTDQNTDQNTYCEVHPDRETSLRCNKCGRLMCVQCAVRTPVGYRCRECVRGQEDKFFNANSADQVIVFVTSAVLAGVATAIMGAISFILFALILGLPAGGFIAEMALRATKRRRGRYSAYIAAGGAAVGGLLALIVPLYARFGSQVFRVLPNLAMGQIGVLIFVGLMVVAVYGRYQMRI